MWHGEMKKETFLSHGKWEERILFLQKGEKETINHFAYGVDPPITDSRVTDISDYTLFSEQGHSL